MLVCGIADLYSTIFLMYLICVVTSIRSRLPKRLWWKKHWIRILMSFTSKWYELT